MIEAETYGVELGEYPGQKEDRRYIVQLKTEICIPDIDLFDISSKGGAARRSVKRRR